MLYVIRNILPASLLFKKSKVCHKEKFNFCFNVCKSTVLKVKERKNCKILS